MYSRTLYGVAVTVLGVATHAHAQSTIKTVAPAKMTCMEFVALEDVYKPAVIYWATGVDKLGVRVTDQLTIDSAHPVAMEVAEECKKTPDTKVAEKVKAMAKGGKLSILKGG